jgi:hypothetical protein
LLVVGNNDEIQEGDVRSSWLKGIGSCLVGGETASPAVFKRFYLVAE